MTTLLIVGFLSGLVTALSPCVLPVLPVVLTTATPGPGSRRRPFVVIGGLVVAFGLFTLVGGAVLGRLGLPADLLRWSGIVVLAVVGLGLVWPGFGHLLEAPFVWTRMPQLHRDGNGFVLGLGLGLVFVPCAGPILASITVLAATAQVGPGLVVLTAAFCLGIAIPLLGFALAGERILARIAVARKRTALMRTIAGTVMMATSLVIALDLAAPLQRLTPSWLAGISSQIEQDERVQTELDALAGRDTAPTTSEGEVLSFDECAKNPSVLADCGRAPELVGITSWLNSAPLNLADLRGRVVLLDFWTYSCINCQRTLPYLTTWAQEYADDGLVVLGVHTPEFAFEKVEGNVAENAERLGVGYPIALDNDFATWRAYDQRYWPAHYLIDATGTVRQVHYGEGAYAETEALIRTLLDARGTMSQVATEPTSTSGRTPETYLGAARMRPLAGTPAVVGAPAVYQLSPAPPRDEVSLGGTWTVQDESALAGDDARLALHFYAAQVHLVLSGEGTVTVTRAGDPSVHDVVQVSGSPALYTLVNGPATQDVLELTLSPGLAAYAFTFG